MPLERYLRPVFTVTLERSVLDVAREMRDRGVGCLVVVREDRPVGVITDRDLTLRVLAESRDPEKTSVADVVTYDPIVLTTHDGIETALEKMRTHGIRRLPIVDVNGKIAGLVTADDVMMLVGRELSMLAEGIESASDATESR